MSTEYWKFFMSYVIRKAHFYHDFDCDHPIISVMTRMVKYTINNTCFDFIILLIYGCMEQKEKFVPDFLVQPAFTDRMNSFNLKRS